MKSRRLETFSVAFLVILTLMTRISHAAWSITANVQKEIWISTTNTANAYAGLGTYKDPYLVATSGDFDSLMKTAITAGVKVFNLGPGTFYTFGYLGGGTGFANEWSMGVNSTFRGAGVAQTTLSRDRAVFSETYGATHAWMVYAAGDNSTVADLTIDCNSSASDPSKCDGVCFYDKNNCIARNVTVKKPFAKTEGGYVFQGSGKDNIYENCEVRECVVASNGNCWISAFVGGSFRTTYRGCRAYLPSGSGSIPIGFLLNGNVGTLVDHCYVENGWCGAYWGVAGATNITIQNSSFKGPNLGVAVPIGTGNDVTDVYIHNNVFELPADVDGANGVYFATYSSITGNYARDIRVKENTFRFTGTPNGGYYYYSVTCVDGASSNIFNVSISNNTMEETMQIFQGNSINPAGVNTFNLLNRWPDGRFPTWLNHAPANPAQRHRITSTSDTIASTDQWVAIRITSADSTFALPSSADNMHSITVYNDQLLGIRKVTITPPSGGSIQPGSIATYDISPNGTARFLYSSGTWYRN